MGISIAGTVSEIVALAMPITSSPPPELSHSVNDRYPGSTLSISYALLMNS